MKKLQRRTLFVLLFILALAAGTVVLCAFYVKDGAQWASFYGNQHVYTNGRIASGSIQDRNGTTLFDCAEGQYSDDKTTRISTLHAIGDKQGNINTGAKNLFADQLVGFSLITGTAGTGNTIKLTLDANLNNAALPGHGRPERGGSPIQLRNWRGPLYALHPLLRPGR